MGGKKETSSLDGCFSVTLADAEAEANKEKTELSSRASSGLCRAGLGHPGWVEVGSICHWGPFLSLLSVGCFGLFVLWFSKLLCLTLAGKEPGGSVKRSFSQQNKFWHKENKGFPLLLRWVGGHACGLFRCFFFFFLC